MREVVTPTLMGCDSLAHPDRANSAGRNIKDASNVPSIDMDMTYSVLAVVLLCQSCEKSRIMQ